MTDKSDDPIIDACLDEVIGGQMPPDLTARILSAWNDAGSKVVKSKRTAKPASAIKVRIPKQTVGSRRHPSRWLAIAASVAMIGLGGAVVWMVWTSSEPNNRVSNQLAEPVARPQRMPILPVSPQAMAVEASPEAPVESAPPTSDPQPDPGPTLVIDGPPAEKEKTPTNEFTIPDERPAPLAEDQIVQAINELIRAGWQREGITAADTVSDDHWCRRVYSRLIGRQPDPRELSVYVGRRSPRKREELVELLLEGESHIEEYASHWGRLWADILLASGSNRANRDGLEQYLRRAFGEGQSFDVTTYELLTATGCGEIGMADYNGATNFLLAHADRRGVHAQATAHVSRTFLALTLDCSQCHVDATWSGIEQQQFWELNAFFRQLDVSRDRDRGLLLADADRATNESFGSDGETYYTMTNGLLKAAYPVFVDGTEIPKSPSVEQVNRRDLLAKFVTRSEHFRQAMANRFWSELFGVGFTIPADNIGPHNPPSHPELLAKLGGQFAAHDYDVRALIRWIVLSEPFALSTGEVATHDQVGSTLVFDRFPDPNEPREPVLKRLQVAQQAFASLRTRPAVGASAARVVPTTDPGAIPTELSDVDKLLATVATEARQVSKTTVYGNIILESNMNLEQKVRHLFFAALHRPPTASEQATVTTILEDRGEMDDGAALEYIWWALATSREAH